LHSEGNFISESIGKAYYESKSTIKNHFGADDNYALIANGYGMTSVVNRLQEILTNSFIFSKTQPVVFLTQYEHNSNFITWRKNGFKCIVLKNLHNGQVDIDDFRINIQKYYDGKRVLIGSFCACSNVTGIKIELKSLINILKSYNGVVCIDYTTIAPYDVINIKKMNIDAIFFSSHKFLGGVGGPGILIISKELYRSNEPTQVGGGTVKWVNPWGNSIFKDYIEEREEAGTPPILPIIRIGLAIKLKEEMGVENIVNREVELAKKLLTQISNISEIVVYDKHVTERLPIISFNFNNLLFQQGIKILSEKYGIQARGGCCCTSILGHRLLNITQKESDYIYNKLRLNDNYENPYGWIRISLSQVASDSEVQYICNAVKSIGQRRKETI
jgi:selenocysteine lyase/cysteine desulfurase